MRNQFNTHCVIKDNMNRSAPSAALMADVRREVFGGGIVGMSVSAYDTAWVAMVPADRGGSPMFGSCLRWIACNQKEQGFWGETCAEGLPTIDSVTSTLACLIALHTWENHHHHFIHSGLEFLRSKAEILVKNNYHSLPRGFILAFPALLDLAEATGLPLALPQGLTAVLQDVYAKRRQILQMGRLEESAGCNPPLISYLETFPLDFDVSQIMANHCSSNGNGDGSIFGSPAATARAAMDTGDARCVEYLRTLLEKFPDGGVPAQYPVDRDLVNMAVVDHVQGLGLVELFSHEIQQLLAQVHRSRQDGKPTQMQSNTIPMKLFKDALAFRLLRTQGYNVHPESFCWFLHDPKILAYMEENGEQLISTMYSVYRATDLSFPEEDELEKARAFANKILQSSSHTRSRDQNMLISTGLLNMIKYELSIPWHSRLDHLYHRKWIEENKSSPLWVGKASFYRIPCLSNKSIMQLAVQHFEYQQSVYARELEELKVWSKKWGLSEMGFGREKTVYTYFATAATSCLPCSSIMRLVVAKSAIIVTVADDFYDMNGSLSELKILTEAIKRWDGKGLQGHSKTIFDALNHFVNNIAASSYSDKQGTKIILAKLQHLWCEAFESWMVERTWSLSGYIPSINEYLETGMISIAAHIIALPATSFMAQSGTLQPCEYNSITKLLMALSRLANDIESYQKEQIDGKMNMVLLHWNETPNTSIQDSIAYVKQIMEAKRKEFLKHVFICDDMPRTCKQIHLSCMKVFQMFFNSANIFDNEIALLDDIKKAIYLPIDQDVISKPIIKPLSKMPSLERKSTSEISKISTQLRPILKHPIRTNFSRKPFVMHSSVQGQEKGCVTPKFSMCFI